MHSQWYSYLKFSSHGGQSTYCIARNIRHINPFIRKRPCPSIRKLLKSWKHEDGSLESNKLVHYIHKIAKKYTSFWWHQHKRAVANSPKLFRDNSEKAKPYVCLKKEMIISTSNAYQEQKYTLTVSRKKLKRWIEANLWQIFFLLFIITKKKNSFESNWLLRERWTDDNIHLNFFNQSYFIGVRKIQNALEEWYKLYSNFVTIFNQVYLGKS